MRFPLLCGMLLLLLLAGAWLSARRAADTAPVVTARDADRTLFQQIPLQEFLHDRANEFSGMIVDPHGRPLPAAQVLVYDRDRLREAIRACTPGSWPAPEPERSATAGADGRYSMQDLRYGCKVALLTAPGCTAVVLTEVSFADGYGAREMDATLEPAPEWTLRVLRADGQAAAGERVRFLPRAFGLSAAEARTGADGAVAVPSAASCSAGPPLLLVGEPPVLLSPDPGQPELRLPPRAPLALHLEGAQDGPLELRLLPDGCRRSGWTQLQVQVSGGRAALDGVSQGGYELQARQGDKVARIHWQHDGKALDLRLEPLAALRVRVQDAAGAPLAALVYWQTAPYQPASAFAQEPRALLDAEDPTRIRSATDATGIAQFADLPGRAGWLLAEAPGYSARALPVPPADDPVVLQLDPAVEVLLRTDRPYLAVEVEVPGSPRLSGRTDPSGEVSVQVPAGPLVARCGFALKGYSYPKGCWAGSGGEPLRFSLLDDRGRPRGCVYGFVLDASGAPVAKADVYLQGADGRPVAGQSDEQGFYRFPGLHTGGYVVFARPSGEYDSMWQLLPVVLDGIEGEEEGEARQDLQIWPGVLEVQFPAGAALPAEVEFRDPAGQRVWSTTADQNGLVRVQNVPPGSYRAVALATAEDSHGRELGALELAPGQAQPARLEVAP